MTKAERGRRCDGGVERERYRNRTWLREGWKGGLVVVFVGLKLGKKRLRYKGNIGIGRTERERQNKQRGVHIGVFHFICMISLSCCT